MSVSSAFDDELDAVEGAEFFQALVKSDAAGDETANGGGQDAIGDDAAAVQAEEGVVVRAVESADVEVAATTTTTIATAATVNHSALPPSVPCATPVEYYLPHRAPTTATNYNETHAAADAIDTAAAVTIPQTRMQNPLPPPSVPCATPAQYYLRHRGPTTTATGEETHAAAGAMTTAVATTNPQTGLQSIPPSASVPRATPAEYNLPHRAPAAATSIHDQEAHAGSEAIDAAATTTTPQTATPNMPQSVSVPTAVPTEYHPPQGAPITAAVGEETRAAAGAIETAVNARGLATEERRILPPISVADPISMEHYLSRHAPSMAAGEEGAPAVAHAIDTVAAVTTPTTETQPLLPPSRVLPATPSGQYLSHRPATPLAATTTSVPPPPLTATDDVFTTTDWPAVPAAVNTETGLGLRSECAASPALPPLVVPRQTYDDLGTVPRVRRDMPALEEGVEGGEDGEEREGKQVGEFGGQEESRRRQSVDQVPAVEVDVEVGVEQTVQTDPVEPSAVTADLEERLEAMAVDDEEALPVEVEAATIATKEAPIAEEDLEARWKAMGVDDAELLEDTLLEDTSLETEGNEADALESPPSHPPAPAPGLDRIPQSTDITAATPYAPTKSAPAMAAPAATTSQAPPAEAQKSPSNPYIPKQYQSPASPPPVPANAYAPHQPSSAELVQGLPYPNTYAARPPPTMYRPEVGHSRKPSSVPSFVDQAKAGYQSPYDLPEEFSKPVKRIVSLPQPVRTVAPPPQQPPARSPTRLQPSPLQPPPRPPSTGYRAAPPPRLAPSRSFAPSPPTIRQAALPTTPPSSGTIPFPPHLAGDGKGGFTVAAVASAHAASAAVAPTPPVTPPVTAVVPTARSVQSSARSRYSPQPQQMAQGQRFGHGRGRGSVPTIAPPPAFTPAGRSAHARYTSCPERELTAAAAAVASPLAPPPRSTASRNVSPAGVATAQRAPVAPPSASSRDGSTSQAAFKEPDYDVPNDGQETDPLQRWKGAPVFRFGFGGVVCSTFPRLVPKYHTGRALPKVKPMPGNVRVRRVADVVPAACLAAEMDGFPGPLTSKSKKKDVMKWMTQYIAQMEEKGGDVEEVLLAKVVRLIVENDGVLTGSPAQIEAACAIISPDRMSDFSGLSPAAAPIASQNSQAQALVRVRGHLMAGLRENAVWEAADSRLWGHALLLASSLDDKSVWRRVSEEFVQREVSALPGAQPLAALCGVLAGNPVECVDQLVPPSARAGLQMMSKTGSSSKASLHDGLDKWRETVVLILRNMSPEGPRALFEISQLLASFGRTAASHVCALFAKAFGATVVFSGSDDPQATVVLLGWDHRRHPALAGDDIAPVLLTEIYEFATAVLGGAPTATLPHLQAFKLVHAERLADTKETAQALEYCDAFASTLKKSGHRPSPYYHAILISRWEELHERLSCLSPDGASTWMSKPSMSKVSGSVWAKFQNFVAGEDVEGASPTSPRRSEEIRFLSTTSLNTMAAPAAVSHPPPQQQQQVHAPALSQPSPYVPQSKHTPANSRDSNIAQTAMFASVTSSPYTPASYIPQSQPQSMRTSFESNATAASASRYAPKATLGHHPSYSASSLRAVVRASPEEQVTKATEVHEVSSGANVTPYTPNQATTKTTEVPISPDLSSLLVAADGETVAGSEQSAKQAYTGYMPPIASTPSESPTPSTVSGEESPAESRGRKRASILEDDEDDAELLKRAAALKVAEEKRKVQEEKEKAKAGQKAAAQQKKGWFSGWFGGSAKKEASPATVVRAKLGEENSFYYDKELKRWVNKKDPAAASAGTGALPPPPKAPAPTKVESVAGIASPVSPPIAAPVPPPVAISGVTQSAPAEPADMAEPQTPIAPPPVGADSVGGAPPPASAPVLPRNIGDASSLEDLLNTPAPAPRVHTAARSKRKGRGYVDLMAQ